MNIPGWLRTKNGSDAQANRQDLSKVKQALREQVEALERALVKHERSHDAADQH